MKPHSSKIWGITVNVKSPSFCERRWRGKSSALIASLFLAAGVACSKKTDAPPPAPPKVTVAHPETRTLVSEAQGQDMGFIQVYKLPASFFADFCKCCLVGISGVGWSFLQYLDRQFFG